MIPKGSMPIEMNGYVSQNPLEYETYQEAVQKFDWSQRWKLVDGNPQSLNIAHECVFRHLDKHTALRIKFSDGHAEIYTFRDFQGYVSGAAQLLLQQGIAKGDRVALILEPCLEFYSMMFGILGIGAIVVPFSPLFGKDAIEYRLKDSRPKLLVIPKQKLGTIDRSLVPQIIFQEDLLDLIQPSQQSPPLNTSARDIAVIQYSSGTTGLPKPVPTPHNAVTLTATALWFRGVTSQDRYFCPSPPSWGHGIWYGTAAPLALGTAVGSYSGKFDPERILEALEEFRISVMSAMPTVYRMIIATGKVKSYDINLRCVHYTGEPMDPETFYKIKQLWGVYPAGSYGSSETGPVLGDFPRFKDWVIKPLSLGKPYPGTQVAIIDDQGTPLPPGKLGYIAIKRGDRWIKIGDAGIMDEEGYFWHKGRADDIIISAGYTIGPDEVEAVLNKHPAVQESAVIGIPDKQRGQIIKAFIKLNPGYQLNQELISNLQEFVKQQLGKHAYPREIQAIDQIPKSQLGKIQRAKLREMELSRRFQDLQLGK